MKLYDVKLCATLERALEEADLNAVRLALYQLTGDDTLASLPIHREPVWGGVFQLSALDGDGKEIVKQKARDYFAVQPRGDASDQAPPEGAERRRLMELYSGTALTENEWRFGSEEIAFDAVPRAAEWTRKPARSTIEAHKVIVVGAGISGIAVAAELTRLGIPYEMFDKEAGPGGTWRINSYPECRVDIPGHLYQFKFEKNFAWSDIYPSRSEMLRYLEYLVEKQGIGPHVRYNMSVVGAVWDEASGLWTVRTRDGEGRESETTANFVVNATGQFAKLNLPDIPGIEDFGGEIFHSAAWDHEAVLDGKRIGQIGNGATGSQLMPSLAEAASHLSVFQRTPQWMIPIENYRAGVSADHQWLFDNLPFYWNWFCYGTFQRTYEFQTLTVYDRAWQAQGGQVSERNDKLRKVLLDYIESKVGHDPALVSALTPSYAPLGRRIIADNGWFDALARPNVDLVTAGIERFEQDGIRTRDGRLHPLDVVVLNTGFKVSDYSWPIEYRGRDGVSIQDSWKAEGPRAYFSMMLPDFPNFFMFYGPNAQPRAGGFFSWAEIWARYVMKLVMRIIEDENVASVEVRSDAFEDYNRRLDDAAKDSIRGPESVGSYYVNEFGRTGINMPWLAEDWHAMLLDPVESDLEFR